MLKSEDETRGTFAIVLVQVSGLLRYTHTLLDHQKESKFWKTANRKEGGFRANSWRLLKTNFNPLLAAGSMANQTRDPPLLRHLLQEDK